MRRIFLAGSGDFGVDRNLLLFLHGSGRRFEQRFAWEKRKNTSLKTASCFCIFHDPRGGLRTCHYWYTMSMMFRTVWSGRSQLYFGCICLVYDGGLEWHEWGWFGPSGKAGYHLGRNRFRLFTLAHKMYLNTANLQRSCSFLPAFSLPLELCLTFPLAVLVCFRPLSHNQMEVNYILCVS